MVNEIPPILEVGGVLISSEILTETFCCDYEKCKGICCVEGDAGAPVTLDEVAGSIVRGKDCVFTCYDGDHCLCALEKAFRNGKTKFCKPISCALYPIREKNFGNGLIGLNYNRWAICKDAIEKGKALNLPVYKFLKEPLIRRFGEAWYDELCEVARLFEKEKD